jgi:hypothetical protein
MVPKFYLAHHEREILVHPPPLICTTGITEMSIRQRPIEVRPKPMEKHFFINFGLTSISLWLMKIS